MSAGTAEPTFPNVERGTNEKAAGKSAELWSEDAERAVLAAMLVDPQAAGAAAALLEAAHFHRPAHRALFDGIQALRLAGTTIDPITLAHELERRGTLKAAGGKDYLGTLYDEIPTAANLEHHARIVRGFARRRDLVRLGKRLALEATDPAVDPTAAVDEASRALLHQATGAGEQGFRPIKRAVFDAFQRLDDRREGRIPLGLKTGWPELDDRLKGGLEPGTLFVVVGVPGSGKTSLVMNLLTNLALDGVGATAMVSAEMTAAMLTDAALSAVSGVTYDHIKTGEMTDDELRRFGNAGALLAAAPFHIDDTVMPDVEDVVTRCVLLKAQHPNLCAVGVDFIQLLQLREKQRGELHETTIRRIAYELKGIALRLGIVVFALAQPNDKQIEDRDDKRPQLRDIQGSSGIRQAANVIALLYRDEMYSSSAGPDIEINLGKNTFGSPGKAILQWEGACRRVVSPRRRQLEFEEKRMRDRQPDLLPAEGA